MYTNSGKMMDMWMYFNTNTNFMHFMFKTLHISGTGALVGVCFVFLLLTVILEASKSLSFYLHAKLKQHPLTYGQTGRSIQNDRSPLFSAIMIPSSIERIKRQRIRFHLGGFTLHIFNLLLGYFIMLAIMTYNVYILIAVILGSGLGHFIFGAFTAMFYEKFERLNKQLYDADDNETLVTEDNNETIMTDGSHHI